MKIESSSNQLEIQEKARQYEKICGGKPDCISVLTSGIKENLPVANTRFKSSSYSEVDEHDLVVSGKARVMATAELSAYFPEAKIITNGSGEIKSKISDQDIIVDTSQIISQELEYLGVNRENIIRQDKSYSTFTELIELIKLISENKWRNVVVMVSELQKSRSEAMFERMDSLHDPNGASEAKDFKRALEEFKKKDVTVKFVSAEDILPLRSKHYETVIEQARQSQAWQKRAKVEEEGAEQIISGEYWGKLPGSFVRPHDDQSK